MPTTQPFRFLDLPAELRLMVYERLPVSPVTVAYKEPDQDNTYLLCSSTKFQTALLATCKKIQKEASPFLKKAISDEQPKITYTAGSFFGLIFPRSLGQVLVCMHGVKDASTLHTTDLAPRERALRKILGLYSGSEPFEKAREIKALSEFCVNAMEHLATTDRKLTLELYCPTSREYEVAALCHRLDGSDCYPPMSFRVLEKRPRALGPEGSCIAGGNVYGEYVSGQSVSEE